MKLTGWRRRTASLLRRTSRRLRRISNIIRAPSLFSILSGGTGILIVLGVILTVQDFMDPGDQITIGPMPDGLGGIGYGEVAIRREIATNIMKQLDDSYRLLDSRATDLGMPFLVNDRSQPSSPIHIDASSVSKFAYRSSSDIDEIPLAGPLSPRTLAVWLRGRLNWASGRGSDILLSFSEDRWRIVSTVNVQQGSGSQLQIYRRQFSQPRKLLGWDDTKAFTKLIRQVSDYILEITRPVDFAIVQAARGNLTQAKAILLARVTLRPEESAIARIRLGLVLSAQGKFAAAERSYRAAASQPGSSHLPWAWLDVGYTQILQHHYIDAISTFQSHAAAARDNRDVSMIQTSLGVSYEHMGQRRQSERFYMQAIQAFPADYWAQHDLCDLRLRHPSESLPVLPRQFPFVRSEDPSEFATPRICSTAYELTDSVPSQRRNSALLLAEALFQAGASASDVEPLVRESGTENSVANLIAWTRWLAQQKGSGPAFRWLKEHKLLLGDEYRLATGEVYAAAGSRPSFVRAAGIFETVARERVTTPVPGRATAADLYLEAAKAWLGASDRSNAARMEEYASLATEDDSTAFWRLAEAEVTIGRIDNALSQFGRAFVAGQRSAAFFDEWGNVIEGEGDGLQQQNHISESIARYADAAEKYSDALSTEPDNATYLVDYADTLRKRALAERALDANADDLLLRAANSYRYALRVDPSRVAASSGLSLVIEALHRQADALRVLDEALDRPPGDNDRPWDRHDAYLQQARMLAADGDTASSSRALEQCIEADSADLECRIRLGDALGANDPERSAQLWVDGFLRAPWTPRLQQRVREVIKDHARFGLAWCADVPSDPSASSYRNALAGELRAMCSGVRNAWAQLP